MTDLTLRRGDTRTLKLWATDQNTGARVTLADKKVWFTAKYLRSDSDGAGVIRKGTPNTGTPGQSTGITVENVGGAPTTAEPWRGGDVATVTIFAADTSALAGDVDLAWDAQLAPAAGGDPQTPDDWNGTLSVEADVTRAS